MTEIVINPTPQKIHKKNNSSVVLGSRSTSRKLFWLTRFFTTFRRSKKVTKVKVSKKKRGGGVKKESKAKQKVKNKEIEKSKKGKQKLEDKI